MKLKLLKKYFSIIFIVATFMGVFHHHNDLKQHPDCKICQLQSSIADADTPVDVVYISKINIKSEAIVSTPTKVYKHTELQLLYARAPPIA